MRSTKSFLIRNYVGLFLLASFSSLALTLAIAYFQVQSVRGLYLERIHKILNLHSNEFLNEIVLEDFSSIDNHLELIRNQLGVDSVELVSGENDFFSEPGELKRVSVSESPSRPSWVSIVFCKQLFGDSPYVFSLTEGFDSIKAELRINFFNSFLSLYVDPFAISAAALFMIFLISIALVFWILFRKIDAHLIEPLKAATQALGGSNLAHIREATQASLGEIRAFAEASLRLNQVDRAIAVSQLAEQVAHDIRSPLAALQVVEGELGAIGEDKRRLLRHAISRIRDIASNLVVARNRGAFPKNIESRQSMNIALAPQYLLGLLESIWTEKMAQYKAFEELEFLTDFSRQSEGALVRVNPVEFKRVISNLVDNSVEALGSKKGQIRLSLSQKQGSVTVSVSDTGKGIPADVLPKLFKRGATFGKIQGSGLGLYHAKSQIESWGGSLTLDSRLGEGTQVRFDIPLCDLPKVFASEVLIPSNAAIVIVDDDITIHELWRMRLAPLVATSRRGLFFFKSSLEFEEWLRVFRKTQQFNSARFLFDYELSSDGPSGLDLIEQYSLQNQSYLVTGRADSLQVATRSACLGVPLIAKLKLPDIPIRIAELSTIDPAVDSLTAKNSPLSNFVNVQKETPLS